MFRNMDVSYTLMMLYIFAATDVSNAWMNLIKANARATALLLAGHKYFEVDKRKGTDVTWKYEERAYFKHFPIPHLFKPHPKVASMCEKNVFSCMEFLAGFTVYSLKTDLELFQFRTTASYYMCWYTMKRVRPLKNFMSGKNCLDGVNELPDAKWVDYKVTDFRTDSPNDPFLCATILFCPDPCYGRKTDGSVPSAHKMRLDPGNPCREFSDNTCSWDMSKNVDFESLKRNKFNITCVCSRTGFEYNSRFEMCVDIDECEDINTKCDKGRQCVNTEGSYECLCPRGQRFHKERNKCVEHAPLPKHSFARSGKVRAQRQRSAFMRMLEYILGLRKDPGA